MKEAMAIRKEPLTPRLLDSSTRAVWCGNHVDLDKRQSIDRRFSFSVCNKLAVWPVQLACSDCDMMPSFLPGINGHPIYSETELHESTLGKRRRRAVSEPTAMDIDSEEGCQSRCSLCNGGSPSTSWPILQPNIDAFNAKD